MIGFRANFVQNVFCHRPRQYVRISTQIPIRFGHFFGNSLKLTHLLYTVMESGQKNRCIILARWKTLEHMTNGQSGGDLIPELHLRTLSDMKSLSLANISTRRKNLGQLHLGPFLQSDLFRKVNQGRLLVVLMKHWEKTLLFLCLDVVTDG